MSFELKRSHSPSESSHLASTKKPRSAQPEGEGDPEGEDHDLPPTAVLSSSADTPSPEHPRELTREQYHQILQTLQLRYRDPSEEVSLGWLLHCIHLFSGPGGCRDPNDAEILLQHDPELRKNLERRDFEKVLNSRTIWMDKQAAPSKRNTTRPASPMTPEMQQAVSAAWTEPYKSSGDMLESVLQMYMTDPKRNRSYARYASITQSSGTGKSRMVDELAKKIFCIPMCLGSNQAYPPPDVRLLSFFESIMSVDADERIERIQFFLCALFETALERVKVIASELEGKSISALASRFRDLMSEGMGYRQHGRYRQEFYAQVCERANALSSRPKDSKEKAPRLPIPTPTVSVTDEKGQSTLESAAQALTSYLSNIPKEPFVKITPLLNTVLCFDEAQLLTRGGTLDSQATLFPDVRRALRLVRTYPILALFLSTAGNLEQFSPPSQLESSDRIVRLELVPLEPIVWTPFDVFARRITKDKVWTLTEVASTNHIAHLGRPLFAAMYDAAMRAGDVTVWKWIIDLACQKLLKTEVSASTRMTPQQLLACIAVRIPIEFNPVTLLQRSEENADVERNLVADHMRLLLYAGAGFSPIITTSASEPLLAEASSSLMIPYRWSDGTGTARDAASRASFDPFLAATHYVGSSPLDLGERGEFATSLLLLYARDRATTFAVEKSQTPGTASLPEDDSAGQRRIVTVRQFLEALLGDRSKECVESLPRAYHAREFATTPLGTAFQDANIYFNHFIKVQSYDVVHQEYLLLAISRGAAIICADGHVGIDIVIPVLIGTDLKKEKITAILVQARNSRHYGARVQLPVFANMNPYTCGLFDRYVEDPPPVLRMVFALASPEAAVATPSVPERRSVRTNRTAKFTAYDIWCAGASHETFAVIQEDEDAAVAKLLKTVRNVREVSVEKSFGEAAQSILRRMQPLVSTGREHREMFADLADVGEYPLAEDAGEDIVG
ncbi:hypothetical protein ACG7TL_006721 [Trametes sanguinea]